MAPTDKDLAIYRAVCIMGYWQTTSTEKKNSAWESTLAAACLACYLLKCTIPTLLGWAIVDSNGSFEVGWSFQDTQCLMAHFENLWMRAGLVKLSHHTRRRFKEDIRLFSFATWSAILTGSTTLGAVFHVFIFNHTRTGMIDRAQQILQQGNYRPARMDVSEHVVTMVSMLTGGSVDDILTHCKGSGSLTVAAVKKSLPDEIKRVRNYQEKKGLEVGILGTRHNSFNQEQRTVGNDPEKVPVKKNQRSKKRGGEETRSKQKETICKW